MRPPLPHQIEGIETLAENSRFILADDMGLGKTWQLILAAQRLVPRYVLVICPAIVRGVWQRELELAEERNITVIRTGGDIKRLGPVTIGGARTQWIIVSYDLFRTVDHMVWGTPDILIADEAHKIKDILSKTNRAVSPLAARTSTFWPATGTPVKNNYSEFFALARLVIPYDVLRQHGVETFHKWRDRFCVVVNEIIHVRGGAVRQVTRITGSRNARELGALVKPWMLRRKKERVLQDLPALRWQPLHISLSRQVHVTDEQVNAAIAVAQRGGTLDDHIAILRVELALAKVAATAQLVLEHVDSTEEPVVVFCSHLDAIHSLAEVLRQKGLRVGVIVGGVSDAERNRLVDAFQAGRLDVMIGQTLAAGTGITLTRAWRSIFIDLAWSPADNAQARDRLHRIGQESAVLSQYLVSDNPLDARVNEILAAKTAAISQLEESA